MRDVLHSDVLSADLLAEVCRLSLQFIAGTHSDKVVDTRPRSRSIDLQLPETGMGSLAALAFYWEHYGACHTRSTGPRYLGFVTGGTTPAAVAGDWLVSILDQNVATERHSIAAYIEAQALAYVTDLLDLPAGLFQGLLTTGATAANLVGLATAREWCGEREGVSVAQEGLHAAAPITVFTAAPHSSIIKSLGVLGLGQRNIVKVGCLPEREVYDLQALEQALEMCTTLGRVVVASAGTVNTGDFDNLIAIAQLCKQHGAWLHVDAAFGAFARCSPAHAHWVRGLELADSITADAHKWLNVPYDCGIALSRHIALQERAFGAEAPYVPMEGDLPAFMNRGIEQSRRYRALPVWMTLMAYGKSGYRDMITRHCGYVQRIAQWINTSGQYELLCKVRLNVLVFRHRSEDEPQPYETLNRRVLRRLNESGELYITPTVYSGAFALRLCISNWMTDAHDIERITAALERCAEVLATV